LVGMGIAANKFNKDSDKAADKLGKFGVNLKGLNLSANDYTKGLDKITTATGKLTDKQKEELEVAKGLERLRKLGLKSSKDLKAQDPVTLEAIRQNQLKQRKLGLSAPSISLIAASGRGSIAGNTTMNGGNITVNVAGSVISQGDLVTQIKNGLEVLYRRRGGSGFAVL